MERTKAIKYVRMTAVQKGDGYYEDVYYTNGRTLSSGVVYLNEKGDFTNAAIQKLGELEDIEEELGIDLIVLAKALKQGGVYVKSGPKVDWETPMQGFQICGDKTNGITLWSQVRLDPKDYGKTWALTKEELE